TLAVPHSCSAIIRTVPTCRSGTAMRGGFFPGIRMAGNASRPSSRHPGCRYATRGIPLASSPWTATGVSTSTAVSATRSKYASTSVPRSLSSSCDQHDLEVSQAQPDLVDDERQPRRVLRDLGILGRGLAVAHVLPDA